jgi:hypothetical protein
MLAPEIWDIRADLYSANRLECHAVAVARIISANL